MKKNKTIKVMDLILKTRRTWKVNPITKVVPNKKKNNRSKKSIKKEIKDYEGKI